MSKSIWKQYLLFFSLTILFSLNLSAQEQVIANGQGHEITIFVIPSLVPIDWSNPAVLYKTTFNSYARSVLQKNYYAIGHTIARVTSPLLPEPCFFAMCGKVFTEKPKMVLIKKSGLGSLGATMQGKLESRENVLRGLKLYSGRHKVAYIKFRVGEESVRRIIKFMEVYQRKMVNGFAPGDLYNGATWPRYENEGSGCSAFGMSVLDVANILPTESRDWKISVRLPMDLIGGEFNNDKRISLRKILKTKSWYVGAGMPDVDYVDFSIYDPSVIYGWIKTKRNQHDPEFVLDEENGIPGLVVDRRNLVCDPNEPIFLPRKDTNLFVKQYYRKLQNMK
ncbi:MAG: hypothetical protein QM800_12260 [Paludibacter sp.]